MRDEGGQNDQFPVGMRVLAVDDDPTCLRVLEALLLRCRYHGLHPSLNVLRHCLLHHKKLLLRENRDKFDLVISDVHMPDMDGFKLLELVGLEMDLPVISIAHGACDYLLKPVRIEELKNIWQHVVRRRKFSQKDYSNFDNMEESERHQIVSSDGGQDLNISGSANQNGKLSRKRKDQNEEDDDDCEENVHENDDLTTQKKPRVVWSIDLHRKFVAAVNHDRREKKRGRKASTTSPRLRRVCGLLIEASKGVRASHRGFTGMFLLPALVSQGEGISSSRGGRRNVFSPRNLCGEKERDNITLF
ncbi:hypothetical protein BHM03_00055043 [Ensete ventricosum]|nr:hypothetical protein BHM03_00055043 [Ensete ventricosum]